MIVILEVGVIKLALRVRGHEILVDVRFYTMDLVGIAVVEAHRHRPVQR